MTSINVLKQAFKSYFLDFNTQERGEGTFIMIQSRRDGLPVDIVTLGKFVVLVVAVVVVVCSVVVDIDVVVVVGALVVVGAMVVVGALVVVGAMVVVGARVVVGAMVVVIKLPAMHGISCLAALLLSFITG
jgi:hypothetical protein